MTSATSKTFGPSATIKILVRLPIGASVVWCATITAQAASAARSSGKQSAVSVPRGTSAEAYGPNFSINDSDKPFGAGGVGVVQNHLRDFASLLLVFVKTLGKMIENILAGLK